MVEAVEMEQQVIAVSIRDLPPPARLLDRTGNVVWQNVPEPLAIEGDRQPSIRMPALSTSGSRLVVELLNVPGCDPYADARLHEAEHRSRNIVSLALAVVRQSLRDDIAQPKIAALLERLRSLEAVVRVGCEVEGDLCSVGLIAKRVTERFEERSLPQITRVGPDVLIAARWAHLIALILHELTANAIRHGALSEPEGRVNVEWKIARSSQREHKFNLIWQEQGGPALLGTAPRGAGMRILTELTAGSARSHGVIEMRETGLSYTLSLSLLSREFTCR